MTYPVSQARLEIDTYGFVLIPELIPRTDALALGARLADLTDARGDDDGAGYRHMTNLFNHLDPGEYEDFLPLVLQPQLLALAQYKLGDGFQIAGPNVVVRDPGVAQHALHADVPLGWFAQQGLPIPRNICFGLQLIWLLTDFTRENGATALLPVSHVLDPPNKWPNDDGEMMYYNDEVRRLRQEIEEGDPTAGYITLRAKPVRLSPSTWPCGTGQAAIPPRTSGESQQSPRISPGG